MEEKKLNKNSKSTISDFRYPKRSVGIQTILQTKEYMTPSVAVQHNLEVEDYSKFFTLPHNLLSLFIYCGIIYYFANSMTYFDNEDSTKRGLLFGVISFIVWGCLYLPDSILRRPHPLFWRFMLSLSLVYLAAITFLLFQKKEQARYLLSYIDPELGVPLPEKSYGENCELSTDTFPYINLKNIYDNIDFYVFAHLFGWFVKTLIVRDVRICWFLSISFEFIELTFKHWLPNFNECWWDHLILDVFGCNALGIYAGSIVIKYFELHNYEFIKQDKNANEKDKKQIKKKVIFNLFKYFTPNYYVKHNWDVFSSTKRFYLVIWYMIIANSIDTFNFFLKYILWLPSTHIILQIRCYIWVFTCTVATREYYEYITNKSCKRTGPILWVSHLMLFIEFCIIKKFSSDDFKTPFPTSVKIFYTGVFMILAVITAHLIRKDLMRKKLIGNNDKKLDLTNPDIDIEEDYLSELEDQ